MRYSLRSWACFLILLAPLGADVPPTSLDLSPLTAWSPEKNGWTEVSAVAINPENPKRLTGTPGTSLFYNGPTGRAINLISKQEFGDLSVHLEFYIPKDSNSGIKLMGLYEVQIADSFGKKDFTASDCGGIYPRAELKPKYHYIDEGYPPKLNACLAPGVWQTLDIEFNAPKFDSAGTKTTNARFAKVILNGQVVQENLSLPCPTGHAWHNKEKARGPLLLQADHGPVAFRSIKVTPRD
jgi:hypothetical protein